MISPEKIISLGDQYLYRSIKNELLIWYLLIFIRSYKLFYTKDGLNNYSPSTITDFLNLE